MIFVFDLDDTICDTYTSCEKYINEFFNYKLHYRPGVKVAKSAMALFDWDEEAAKFWCRECGDDMLAQLPAKEGAAEMINDLYDAGHRIVIVAQRPKEWFKNPEKSSQKWLKKMGIRHNALYVNGNKLNICESERADVFVDDGLTETEGVEKLLGGTGTKVFLVNSEYNDTRVTPSRVVRLNKITDLTKKLGLTDNFGAGV